MDIVHVTMEREQEGTVVFSIDTLKMSIETISNCQHQYFFIFRYL